MITRQRGVSLVAAIFLLVGLSLLGALMTVLVSSQSTRSVSDYYATQALYAAESGVQLAAFDINHNYSNPWDGNIDCDNADRTNVQLDSTVDAWVTIRGVAATDPPFNVINACEITVTGKAGGSAPSPIAQRTITATYTATFMNN